MKIKILLTIVIFSMLSYNNAFGVKILDAQDEDNKIMYLNRYEIFNEAITWNQAKIKCEELGGHLATITSEKEYNTILKLLPKNEQHLYWLGATDSEREGKWKWITGEPFIFTKWHKGEPNDEFGQEDFLNLTNYWSPYNNQWGWNDENGNRVISGVTGFICEYEATYSVSQKNENIIDDNFDEIEQIYSSNSDVEGDYSEYTEPPENGQWAYALTSHVRLYVKHNRNSRSSTIEFPNDWVSVIAVNRDENNNLWYKVTVNGRTGWVFQTGMRLKFGKKSKVASGIYKRCAKVREKVMNKKLPGWKRTTADGIVTYVSRGAKFQIIENGKRIEDLEFSANTSSKCKDFLGFNAIGMDRNDLRKKLGTATMRETPPDEPNVNILSYELPDRNMTLVIYMRRPKGQLEALVESFELYKGRTGTKFIHTSY